MEADGATKGETIGWYVPRGGRRRRPPHAETCRKPNIPRHGRGDSRCALGTGNTGSRIEQASANRTGNASLPFQRETSRGQRAFRVGCRSNLAASWVAAKNRLNQAAKRPRICQLPPSPIAFPRKRLKGGRMQMCATRRIVERSFVALPPRRPRRPRRGKGGSRSPTLDVGYAGGMGVKDQSRALHRFYNAGHLESLDPCKVVSAPDSFGCRSQFAGPIVMCVRRELVSREPGTGKDE